MDGRIRLALVLTAMLCQIGDQVIHGVEIRCIDNMAAMALGAHQAGSAHLLEMKRQGSRGQREMVADRPCRQTPGTHLNQAPKDVQASFLCQRRERAQGFNLFHISNIIELYFLGQYPKGGYS